MKLELPTSPSSRHSLQGIQERLSGEVLRKLTEACSASSREEESELCNTIFTDVAGE
eukprot:CAMPEP_0182899048 /NCGR_PEP_ID=MMETSP0034_2-20130328/27848_1 /TAXON_ID=156128 /ORGANISM="Nephroselmis pyriformis, Strain CCMP717" /LENGTH=56 /DNA_ID=CAMNT_0025033045 /DNA_START=146 /DNA_END=313 /DNA_ORIENTATION=+